MNPVLAKVIVARFYKVNAGFFFMAVILLFGIMSARETLDFHLAVMAALMSHLQYAGVGMLVWAVYSFKCTRFVITELHQPENSFLFTMQGASPARQFAALLLCHLAIYAPLLEYAVCTLYVGFRHHQPGIPALFLIFQLAMCLLPPLLYFNVINSTWKPPLITLPALPLFRRKTWPFYLLHFSLDSRKGTFITVKLFSLLLLQVMIAANADAPSREAICVLMMFLIAAHSLLPLYYVQFSEVQLSFQRNLPIPVLRRFAVYLLTYAIIFVPELLFLLLNVRNVMPLHITLSVFALSVTQMALYTAVQYIRGITTERYAGFVAGLFFTSLLLLATTSIWLVSLTEMVLATALFTMRYHRYELSHKAG